MIVIMGFVIYFMAFMTCFCLGFMAEKVPGRVLPLIVGAVIWFSISAAVVWTGKSYLSDSMYLARLYAQIPVAAAGIISGAFAGKMEDGTKKNMEREK